LVARVNVTEPVVIAGVYEDDILVLFENEPLFADQTAEVAPPPNEPARVTLPPAQTD
jgi:hypothetical protein